MSLSIAQIGGELSKGSVVIRGTAVKIHALTKCETRAIRVVFPRPEPPLTLHNPNAGSGAPKLPNTEDPKYVADTKAWLDAVMAVEIAAASELQIGGKVFSATMDPAQLKAWGDAAITELEGEFTAHELRAWSRDIGRLAEGIEERAERQLIVDLGEAKGPPAIAAKTLPEKYGVTALYRMLRACELFKIDPRSNPGEPLDKTDPGELGQLVAYADLRERERAG